MGSEHQAMAALPDVVKRLADDIQWTTDLGNAFLAQQKDVMDAIPAECARSSEQRGLQSNQQQKVETQVVESKQVIVIGHRPHGVLRALIHLWSSVARLRLLLASTTWRFHFLLLVRLQALVLSFPRGIRWMASITSFCCARNALPRSVVHECRQPNASRHRQSGHRLNARIPGCFATFPQLLCLCKSLFRSSILKLNDLQRVSRSHHVWLSRCRIRRDRRHQHRGIGGVQEAARDREQSVAGEIAREEAAGDAADRLFSLAFVLRYR